MARVTEPRPPQSHKMQAYGAKETFPSHPLLGQARRKAAEAWSSHHLFQVSARHVIYYTLEQGHPYHVHWPVQEGWMRTKTDGALPTVG